jgi:hypothetical protein
VTAIARAARSARRVSRAVLLIGTGIAAACGSNDPGPADASDASEEFFAPDAAYGASPLDVQQPDVANDVAAKDAAEGDASLE